MKKILTTLLISVFLFGCCTVKRVQTTAQETTQTETEQTFETVSQTVQTVETTETESDVVISTIVETFDTDKPVDPITGTPPLRSRTNTTTQKQTKTTAQSETTAQTNIEAEQEKQTHGQSSSQTVNKKSQKIHGKFIFWLALLVVALLIFTFRKSIKNIFKTF